MEKFELMKGTSSGVGESDLQQKIRLAEEKVASLQEVIKKLQTTKKFLHLNAVEVKASIHSNISRLLESMRNREVFLLHQVDVILEAKEERLRGQEDQLNQAIGRLSNCLSLLDGGTSLSTELNDILSRIDSHGKHPVESPHICFRADMTGLRQAVHEFGRVDSKGLPLEAFASPHVRSSSLPKPFEDYEDDEHHVFHKTVHEIHEKKHGKSIIFNIPKLSSANLPSWVSPTHQPFETKNLFGSSSQPAVGPKSKLAMTVGDRKKPTTACTISQWMQEIKMEEEGDEIMTSQLTSKYGNKGLVTSASDSSLLSGSRTEAQKMTSEKTDMKPWLSQHANSTKTEGVVHNSMFSFLSARLQDWLIDGESRLPKTKPAFEPFVFKPSSDVKENVLESQMRKMATKPLDFWLASSTENPKLESDTRSDLLESYAKNVDLLPWLSSSLGFSKEPALESGIGAGAEIIENHAKRIANLAWLASEKEAESGDGPTNAALNSNVESRGSEQRLPESSMQTMSSDSRSWLLTKDEQESSLPDNNKTSSSDFFMKTSQLPTSHWLPTSSSPSLPSSLSLPADESDSHMDQGTTGQEEKLDRWFKSAADCVSVSGFEKCINALNVFPIDHWLVRASVENSSGM